MVGFIIVLLHIPKKTQFAKKLTILQAQTNLQGKFFLHVCSHLLKEGLLKDTSLVRLQLVLEEENENSERVFSVLAFVLLSDFLFMKPTICGWCNIAFISELLYRSYDSLIE